MSKLNVRPVYVAALAGAIVGAAIGIPAWAASGGGGSNDQRGDRAAPLRPPPPAGFGLEMRGFPSAAEARRMHERLDDVADCLREHGADIPGVSVRGHGVSLRVPRAQAEAITKRVAKECGMPPPPPPGKVFPLTRKQMEKGRKAITRGDCPPLPPALPRRK